MHPRGGAPDAVQSSARASHARYFGVFPAWLQGGEGWRTVGRGLEGGLHGGWTWCISACSHGGPPRTCRLHQLISASTAALMTLFGTVLRRGT